MGTSGNRRFVVVLGGAGAMGRAAVFDLARSGVNVLLLDSNLGAARKIAGRYGAGAPRSTRSTHGMRWRSRRGPRAPRS
jgi:NAD(P)-dependent dehydrogenase (short-subunit alcohol dehydrogenase family)